MYAIVDGLIRGIILIASVASFIPQTQQIVQCGSSVGLSLWYLTLNAVAFTEQFTLMAHLVLVSMDVPDSAVRTPPSVRDWLNLTQAASVWICWDYIPLRPLTKSVLTLLPLAYLAISLLPVAFEASPLFRHDEQAWFRTLFLYYHSFYIHPIVTLLIPASAVFQAWVILSSPHSQGDPGVATMGVLDIPSLAVQAGVFGLGGLYRAVQMRSGEGVLLSGWRWWNAALWWYGEIGWAAVDNILFAVVQGTMFWLARRRMGLGAEVDSVVNAEEGPTERTPLLEEEDGEAVS